MKEVYSYQEIGTLIDQGKQVVFMIGNCKGKNTGKWDSQSDTELNLTFDSACLAGVSHMLHLPMVTRP